MGSDINHGHVSGRKKNINIITMCEDLNMQKKKNEQCERTYVLLGDEPGVSNMDDLPIVVDGRHGNRILADLGGNVFLHLEAEILQHQVA